MTAPKQATARRRPTSFWLATLLAIVFAALITREVLLDRKTTVGQTTAVKEVSSGLTFKARVDTGAAVSSIHCVEFEIADEVEDAKANVGKTVRMRIANERGQVAWIETAIVDYAAIRTSDATGHRYYVRLTLSCAGVEKQALVTLKDRSEMQFKLLLGRDFLEHHFVVDVSR